MSRRNFCFSPNNSQNNYRKEKYAYGFINISCMNLHFILYLHHIYQPIFQKIFSGSFHFSAPFSTYVEIQQYFFAKNEMYQHNTVDLKACVCYYEAIMISEIYYGRYFQFKRIPLLPQCVYSAMYV